MIEMKTAAIPASTVVILAAATSLGLINIPAPADPQPMMVRYIAGVTSPNEGYSVSAWSGSVAELGVSISHGSDAAADREISSPQEVAVMSRIDNLSALHDGWVGAKSKAPDGGLLSWVKGHAALIASGDQEVSVIPMASGALALQWADAECEYTAELHADHRMLLYVDHLASDDMEEAETDLSDTVLAHFLATGSVA